ncbi:PhzF family phenazine biosynthesis protein [Methylobacterium sp. WL120]|uniref:PhzF family phenazine biosynthesis protein n=1 Tax=Methylobacterium sp. WL120 TaxID=2603887 RepID=UPI0011C6F612|nr:PhzF family phenazine biosynthesis protein [Methylobacterium sp. WL120]TXM65129.1 PhzF family phenazine biosynthesis protein [Methylobacterium sp. WL120]
MPRRFVTLDVFTTQALAGNPLAAVLDADGLDTAAMQAIAREFNLSETVFVMPPDDPRHRARLRIFTPARELPFAGHPTIGTAVLLAVRAENAGTADTVAFGLEEAVGTIPCVVEVGDGAGRARFKLPILPKSLGDAAEAAELAAAFGLTAEDIGFGRHRPSRHGVGPSFTFVPVLSRARLDAAQPGTLAGSQDGFFLYAPDEAGGARAFQARMFAPALGVPEDPATGSAAAAFAGVLMQFETLGDGTHDVAITQGVAMGRPSEIALQLVIEAGALRSVEIGGAALIVSEGLLHV